MKRIALGSGLILIAVVALLLFLNSNLDRLVQKTIETAGSAALGTQVSVAGVSLELTEGRASIHGFAIANPEGFSDNELLRFDELSVALDLATLGSDQVGILSIATLNPRVYFESRGRESNIDVLRDRLDAGNTAPDAASSGEASPVQLSIGRVDILGIEAVLVSDQLQQPVTTQLDDIHLEDLQGTPEEVARQIADPLLRQLASQIASSLLKISAANLKDSAAELGRSALEKAADAGESLKEGLDNLLQRN